MKQLILGGARSGKSALAEKMALDSGLAVTYIATATAGDEEMAERIAHHRARRPVGWRLVEEPLRLASAIAAHAAPDRCLIVDCLTLWLNNLLAAEDEALLCAEQRAALLASLPNMPGHIIFVSNEVGMGIVPLGELSRRFCDEAGRLHQDLAQICDRVIFVAAGLPLVLKGTPL
ncbi:MAG: bifunctional adenosylcobinamide kinase/adenosylcobinamide-phosphate guanylyltransferase [Sulfuricellaceae bacterium]|nr:bifunctional adenosylcobinamide kinase/adenosylcobinamide-phosphate guanylyltransferase [Sulfuricellaceae bacterium]